MTMNGMKFMEIEGEHMMDSPGKCERAEQNSLWGECISVEKVTYICSMHRANELIKYGVKGRGGSIEKLRSKVYCSANASKATSATGCDRECD